MLEKSMLGSKQVFSKNSLFAFFKKPTSNSQQSSSIKRQDIQAIYQHIYQMIAGKPLNHARYKTAADLLAQISEQHLIPSHLTCYENLPELSIGQVQKLFECNPRAALALLPDVRISIKVSSYKIFFDLLKASADFAAFLIHYPELTKFVSMSYHVIKLIHSAPSYCSQLLFDLRLIELVESLNDICLVMQSVPHIIPSLLHYPKFAEILKSYEANSIIKTTISYLQDIASDHADAAFALGYIYQHGYGWQAKNEEQARYYYDLARCAGHPHAADIYANYYLEQAKGHINEQQPDVALTLLQKIPASHLCYGEALFLMGEIIMTSIPESANSDNKSKAELGEAIKYLNQAALIGYSDAVTLRNNLLVSYYDLPYTYNEVNLRSEELLHRFVEEQLLNKINQSNNFNCLSL